MDDTKPYEFIGYFSFIAESKQHGHAVGRSTALGKVNSVAVPLAPTTRPHDGPKQNRHAGELLT